VARIGRRVGIEVEGLREVIGRFNQLDQEIQGLVLVEALVSAGTPLLETIEPRIPRQSGELASHADMRTLASDSTHAIIGVGIFDDPVAPWVEFGHRAVHEGKEVGHVPAHPFVRPAWAANRATAPDQVSAALVSTIEAVWDKGGV